MSSETLYWKPLSETKSVADHEVATNFIRPNTHHHQLIHRYFPHHAQIQPVHSHRFYQQYAQKPKSWDNLTTKSFGGYGFGYGYLDTVSPKQTTIANSQTTSTFPLQKTTIPRANSAIRRSVYGENVENYAPPPTNFIQHITKTTTTTITAESTEQLIGAFSENNSICECLESDVNNSNTNVEVIKKRFNTNPKTLHQQLIPEAKRGYYSNLHVSKSNHMNKGILNSISTTSEITRL